MNRIYLVRHAESLANTRGIYQGQTYDTPLSRLGERQAEALARHLSGIFFDRIIASPLLRTMQTACTVAAKHGQKTISEPRLLEVNHGWWEGRSKADIAGLWPDIYRTWKQNPSRAVFPGGESFRQTAGRAVSWLRQAAGYSGNTLVITHDGIIRALLTHLFSDSLDRIWTYDLHPASVTLVEDGRVMVVNNMAHLQGLSADLSVHAL